MKSKQQKRTEALARLRASIYNQSKAKRLNTLTEAQWQKQKDALINYLETMPTGY